MSTFSSLRGMGDILKHARQMSQQLGEMRERLRSQSFTASVGGDLVKAVVNGEGELLTIEIDPSVTDRKMLEDLVVAAVNQAAKKAREAYREALSGLTGGIDVAGMLGLM